MSERDIVPARRGLLDVLVTLRHFAIVTFAVRPEALARQLAPGFEPEVFGLADGSQRALISAVAFLDVGFRFRVMPWPRFTFGQTNYRAYVRHEGERCAWFFGTSLATPFVLVPRWIWRMPWHHARMRFDVAWSGERCARYALTTRGGWGAADVRLAGTDEPTGTLDGFADDDETALVLTHPTDGYFRRSDGRVATYSIWHAPLVMRRATAERAHFEVFEELGLVEHDQAPHSVLVQRETDYVIFLPPRALPPSRALPADEPQR